MIPPISICSYEEAGLRLTRDPERYQYLISIGSPQEDSTPGRYSSGLTGQPVPNGFEEFQGQKLRCEFDDISYPTPGMLKCGYIPAERKDVLKIVEFCKMVDGPTLIHCAAGISRSSAAALILIATKMGKGREAEALHHLVTLEDKDPDTFPNELILYYADAILERNGDLIEAYRKVYF